MCNMATSSAYGGSIKMQADGYLDFEPSTEHSIIYRISTYTKRVVVSCSCRAWEKELPKGRLYLAEDDWFDHVESLIKKVKK